MPPLRERNANVTARQAPYKVQSKSSQPAGSATARSSKHAKIQAVVDQPEASIVTYATESDDDVASVYGYPGPSNNVAHYDCGPDSLYKWNCNQIRKKIRALIDSGEMRVTHFQKAIGVYSSDYGRFMKMTKPMQGSGNTTYSAATVFFWHRERNEPKAPRPRKATATINDEFNVDDMELEDEREGDIPVYDTCDDIRDKIWAHLRKPNVTQAGFCREIVKTYRFLEPDKNIQSTQLKNFLGQDGARSGNMSAVYYAAYVYFEKLRIKNGAHKTNKRLRVEAEHWNGMDRKTNWANQRYIGSADTQLYMDDLGFVFGRPM